MTRVSLRLPRRSLHSPRVKILAVSTALTSGLLLCAPAAVSAQTHAPVTTYVTINPHGSGRVFDGIGAISGGGGNSRLLINYPEPYRSEILDYLFKPDYGAALQILKVEIGGDGNSTDGAESSIEHSRGHVACDSGYEWWLMEQAKALNPSIKFYGLSWGAPGWIGKHHFWSYDMISYLVSWLGCAKSHGLTISYLGGWNENGWQPWWFIALRKALNAAGYTSTQIVAADNSNWDVATDLANNQAFDRATAIIGAHYPCGGDGSPALTCTTTSTALALNKPLWASENGSQDANSGAPAMIRAIIRGYVDASMTAYINWPLVAAIPDGLPFETTGLTVDAQPWAGSYDVGEQVWTAAQVTQFAQPGWSFIDSASGDLGGGQGTGSYVTLRSPSRDAYSTIVETTTATSAQKLDVTVDKGMPTGTVHVWATNLASVNPASYFDHVQDITPVNGHYSLTLKPNYIYTLTTTTGQHKGSALGAPPAQLGLPYTDDISHASYPLNSEPPYLSDQDGAFEVEPCLGGRTGDCLQQMAPRKPIEWANHAGTPYTVVGDNSWTDYTISADVLLHQAGSADLIGRFEGRDYYQIGHIDAYYLSVDNLGNWSILKNTTSGTMTTLASGTVAALGLNTWHHLALTFSGDTITAAVDGTMVGSATDSSYAFGPAGLGVGTNAAGGWLTDQFDNLSVTPAGTPSLPGTAEELVNRTSGDVLGTGGTAGTTVVTGQYKGVNGQQWYLSADGDAPGQVELLNGQSGQAATAPHATPLTKLVLQPATQAASQLWRLEPVPGSHYFTVIGPGGLAATASGAGSAVALLARQGANGSADQQWTLLPAPAASLADTFNNTGVTDDTNPGPVPGFVGFDGVGTSYSAEGLAADGLTPGASVTVDGTPLTWPNVASAQPDNTVALGQAVALHGSGSKLTFLLAANNSPESGTATVYYTDGTSTSFSLGAGNFWFAAGQSGNPAQPQVAAVNYANFPTGSSGHTIFLFGQSVPLNPHKTLAEVVLPALSNVTGDNAGLHVFALGTS